jgi:hypothetical protein
LSIRIVNGHAFRKEDRTSNDSSIILSKRLADVLFPGVNPVGEHLQPGLQGPWSTVVGVAQNVKNGGLTGEDEPEYYRLRRDRADDWDDWRRGCCTVLVRTSMPPAAMTQWIRSTVATLDPTVPVVVETMDERVDQMADRPRFESALLGLFALVGVLLAAIGIYGVISFMVAQRTQEIGIRMALGASRTHVLKLVAGGGARLIAIGAGLGLMVSLLIARAMASLLFGVGPADPLTFVAVVLLMAAVALVATWIPARSATRVDPLVALRYE